MAWKGRTVVRATALAAALLMVTSSCAFVARASVDANGAQATGASDAPTVSADGRYVAYASVATDIISPDTNGAESDVFRRDNLTGAVQRISASQRNGNDLTSTRPTSSADGQLVAYETGVVAAQREIWIRRVGGSTNHERVDAALAGSPNGDSTEPSISDDGVRIVYTSAATNLVTGDGNGVTDVFVHDTQTDATTRVSVDSGGVEATGASGEPAISGDGRYVVFSSVASDLAVGDSNGVSDVFVHDTQTGATSRVSVDSGGTQASGASSAPSVSAAGDVVAFASTASDLVPGDTNALVDVFVRDLGAATTTRLSTDAFGVEAIGGSGSGEPALADDGSHLAYSSSTTNLVADDTNAVSDVFVKRVVVPTITSVVGPAGSPGEVSSI
ncbi:MAG: TolB family protein, partial [Acidimicrobiales bacterium]